MFRYLPPFSAVATGFLFPPSKIKALAAYRPLPSGNLGVKVGWAAKALRIWSSVELPSKFPFRAVSLRLPFEKEILVPKVTLLFRAVLKLNCAS
ncbi:hypothetical protein D3C86_1895100 [compost metagenome]